MKLGDNIYSVLVNQVPGIRRRYHKYRDGLTGKDRARAWGYLLKLNLEYYLLQNKELKEPTEMYPDKGKKLYTQGSESSLSRREKPAALAEKLAAYDVISFDVFDTLLLRPFSKPSDLFFLVGEELNYLDFERIRREMEWKTREKICQKYKTREVTFQEIWEVMEKETGIPATFGSNLEWETERKYCFANPYFTEVFRELQKYRTKIVITSDMYLRKEQIRELLDKNGFKGIEEIFVSCEYRASKGAGTLYRFVKERMGKNLSYVHVGDNPYSDQKKAQEAGFFVIPYQNVNEFGERYRAEEMSPVTGSLYRGLVNAHLHNGLKEYSIEYEFGFLYGGLFVLGYCQFIHEYVKIHGIEKILFLARDGDILNQMYQKLYPEERDKCRYVYWSRLAAAKMTAGYFKYDYFRRFLYHKVNQSYSLENIFRTMELEDMFPDFLQGQESMDRETELTDKNVSIIKTYLMKNWKWVLEHYKRQTEAGGIYYKEVLGDSRKAVAVDVGWAGSGAVALDYLVNKVWKLGCDIVGIVAGTNTVHNGAESNASESFLYSGKIVSYLFSQNKNREMWRNHDLNKGHNIIVEMLLCSEKPPFKGFKFGEKSFGKPDIDKQVVSDIQEGIKAFIDLSKNLGWQIEGEDVNALFRLIYGNKKYTELIKGKSEFNPNI
ncbi:hypothetical protein [Blautia sp. An46]|uniref:hypothetical protein n=1 Tax=Blautia sp. An46 TaxID=1965636 RepID=UPI00111CDC23|nr:hypothetical protein [Blautia sp. An46]